MSDEYSSGGGYCYELLKADNWMLWKCWMLAVFQDLGLEKYIAKDAKAPESADPEKPTASEIEVKNKWAEGDGKVCTWIELSIRIAKMIHISGVITASQMWDQWWKNHRANLESWPLGMHYTEQQQRRVLTWWNIYQTSRSSRRSYIPWIISFRMKIFSWSLSHHSWNLRTIIHHPI